MASEHEEAIRAAVNTLKSLIHVCIDESLMKQGMDQITMSATMDARKSGPTIIEKLCATLESLLGYHYTAVWDLAFQVVSAMFDKLGNFNAILIKFFSFDHFKLYIIYHTLRAPTFFFPTPCFLCIC